MKEKFKINNNKETSNGKSNEIYRHNKMFTELNLGNDIRCTFKKKINK